MFLRFSVTAHWILGVRQNLLFAFTSSRQVQRMTLIPPSWYSHNLVPLQDPPRLGRH